MTNLHPKSVSYTQTKIFSINFREKSITMVALMIKYLLLIALIIWINNPAITPSYSATQKGTSSQKIISITKKIILGAAKVGLEEAGTRIMGSTWPFFKAALSPLFDELKRQYPGFARLISDPGPNADNEARRIVDTISTNPRLQHLIIDGFGRLKNGQREIVNRIGQMESVLQEQNQEILDYVISFDRKFAMILEKINRLEKQGQSTVYTEGLTMYDIEGVWRMVALDGYPNACSFKKYEHGIYINPISAVTAKATYAVPIVIPPLGKNGKARLNAPYNEWGCISITQSHKIELYGNLLKLPLSVESEGDFTFSKDVEVSGDKMTLEGIAEHGNTHTWYYKKNKPAP